MARGKGTEMRTRKITDILALALAALAAAVAAGLIAGRSMWAWIVAYWLILVGKNALDCAGRFALRRKEAGRSPAGAGDWDEAEEDG